MLATAGNTTNDGFIGAIVNDCLMDRDDDAAVLILPRLAPRPIVTRVLGASIAVAGVWMLVAKQARMGLPALRWMSEMTFPGEAVAGAIVLLAGVTLAGGRVDAATAADRQQS